MIKKFFKTIISSSCIFAITATSVSAMTITDKDGMILSSDDIKQQTVTISSFDEDKNAYVDYQSQAYISTDDINLSLNGDYVFVDYTGLDNNFYGTDSYSLTGTGHKITPKTLSYPGKYYISYATKNAQGMIQSMGKIDIIILDKSEDDKTIFESDNYEISADFIRSVGGVSSFTETAGKTVIKLKNPDLDVKVESSNSSNSDVVYVGQQSKPEENFTSLYYDGVDTITFSQSGIYYLELKDKNGERVELTSFHVLDERSKGTEITNQLHITGINNTEEIKTYSATQTSSSVFVNGNQISFDAYNINNNNYFKLRDVAKVLNGTNKQFEVTWDSSKNAINILSNKPYTTVGGELTSGDGSTKSATLSTSEVYVDGEQAKITAYNINGNNYFKLRDIGEIFDFSVDWNANNNSINIDTDKSYN